jgi:hypothetical protein
MTYLDQRGVGTIVAGQKMRDEFYRPLRRGEANARQAFAGQMIETFERKRQMGAALVIRDRVNFIDDHRLNGS